jgi:hypothetical protein
MNKRNITIVPAVFVVGFVKGLARVVLAAVPVVALGAPITLTLSGTATGTLGATAFTNAPFTLTSTGDTSARIVDQNGADLPVTSSAIRISGFPDASFTDSGVWEDPQPPTGAVAGDVLFLSTDRTQGLGIQAVDVGLDLYRFSSSFGPVSGSKFGSFSGLSTSGGILTITGTSPQLTFLAIVSPEPSTGWLLVGVISMLWACNFIVKSRRS